jgi:excisionase family DNA binding protein
MSKEVKLESLLSEKEAAARLGISRPALLKLRRRGEISHFRIGARVLYSEDTLREFLAAAYKKRRGQKSEAAAKGGADV